MKVFAFIVLLLGGCQAYAEAQNASDFAAGGQLFKVYCADACHQAPAARRLKPQQWRIVLETMQVRMQSAGMPPLTESQFGQVFTYLKEAR